MLDPISKEVLEALLFFIDEDDIASALAKSYGDFGNDLRKAHRNESAGNSKYHITGKNTKVEIELHEYGGATYELTWNKAAKAIHTYLHAKAKAEAEAKKTRKKK